jgi:hypothetical protein
LQEASEDIKTKTSVIELLRHQNAEIQTKLENYMQQVHQAKDSLVTQEEQFNQGLATQTRLCELYKVISDMIDTDSLRIKQTQPEKRWTSFKVK